MLVTSIFSFSHNVFCPIKNGNHHFSNNEFVVCKCFRIELGQDFVVWQRVKPHFHIAWQLKTNTNCSQKHCTRNHKQWQNLSNCFRKTFKVHYWLTNKYIIQSIFVSYIAQMGKSQPQIIPAIKQQACFWHQLVPNIGEILPWMMKLWQSNQSRPGAEA